MKKKIENLLDYIIDNSNPNIVDKVCIILFCICSLVTLYLFGNTLAIISNIMIPIHPRIIYSINTILIVSIFFISFLGDSLKKPSNRPGIFLGVTLLLAFNTYSLLSEILNFAFTSVLNILLKMSDIPYFIISTNTKIISVFVPLAITMIVFYKPIESFFNKSEKILLTEFRIDALMKNVNKLDPLNVDIKLGDDFHTGKPIVVNEKKMFEHLIGIGGSGSGKTSLGIRPHLSQVLHMKAFYREALKKRTLEALEQDLCYFKVPYSNKYINENFNMNLVQYKDGKRDEFIQFYKDLIVGVRDSLLLINVDSSSDNNIELPYYFDSNAKKYYYEIVFLKDNSEMDRYKIYTDLINDISLETEIAHIKINHLIYKKLVKSVDEEGNVKEFEDIDPRILRTPNGEEKSFSNYSNVLIENPIDNYNYKVSLYCEADDKIIFKNCGLMVIAPDGGLASDTEKIAAANDIKVKKLDAKLSEIRKGIISYMNPVMVSTPAKAGDVISSILVAMDQGNGDAKSNPYYTNATIRAVRNLIVLLRLTYYERFKINPTLEDVLAILNDMNSVEGYVTTLKKNPALAKQNSGLISYFETSFYNVETDAEGNRNMSSNIGVNQKKTREALSGLVTQLDNLIGREELKYILCNRDVNGIKLDESLENGDVICVSTRQAELGPTLGKAFGLMVMLSVQNAVLSRYSEDEQPEIPFYLWIDEYKMYANEEAETFFTFSRKYKCSVNIYLQALSHLDSISEYFKQSIITNCSTMLVLPGANVEDREYFSKYFGVKEELELSSSISVNPALTEMSRYSESVKSQLKEKNNVTEEDLHKMEFKTGFYSTVDRKGRKIVGRMFLDFVNLNDENTVKVEYLDFGKYLNVNKKDNVANEPINPKQEEVKLSEKESKENLDTNKIKNELKKRFKNSSSDIKPNKAKNDIISSSANLGAFLNVKEVSELIENNKEDNNTNDIINQNKEISNEINIPPKEVISNGDISNYNIKSNDNFNMPGNNNVEVNKDNKENKFNDLEEGNNISDKVIKVELEDENGEKAEYTMREIDGFE